MNYQRDYHESMARYQEEIRLAEERGRQKMKQQLLLVIILLGIGVFLWTYGASFLNYAQTPATSTIIIETTSTPTYTPLNQPTVVPTQGSGGVMGSASSEVDEKPVAVETNTGPQGGLPTDTSKTKP